jgi:peptide/nickel transport system substrate-binding protein/oligopeptide transport system substrate-binding protein
VIRTLRPLAALLTVVAVVATACSSGSHGSAATTTTPHSGGTLRLAVVGLDSLDPAQVVPTNQADMIAIDLLDEGLTSIDPVSNAAVPALASKWTSDAPSSSNTTAGGASATVGTTWTFQLDSHARFSDGSAVTAADVVTSLTAVAKQGNRTLAGARLDVVAGYDDLVSGKTDSLVGLRADGDKVEVTTDQPDAELPLLLGSPVYSVTKPAPSSTTTTNASGQASLVAPIGSGPFKLASDNGTTVKLTRSATSAAQLDEVDLIREKTSTAALAAVRAGAADWAAVPPAKKASATGGSIGYTVQAPLGAEQFFGMNLASPTFANPLFRQAIIKSIDRNSLVATVLPGLHVSSGVVPQGVPGSVPDACGATCTFDRSAARQLLHRAFPGGRIPIVEIDTDADPTNVSLARTIAVNLRAVNIPVQVKIRTFVSYQRFITTGRQQLFRTGWVGLSPSAGAYLDPLFRSNSLDNSTAFKSAHIDGALSITAALADAKARATQYAAIQRTIVSDAVVVPIVAYTQVIAVAAQVHNYAARLDGTFDVDKVEVTGS